MRLLPLLAALPLALSPSLAAQAVVVSGSAVLDSVLVWANLEGERASAFTRHVIRGRPGHEPEGALFFALPEGAEVQHVTIYEAAAVIAYDTRNGPAESRRAWERLPRHRRGVAARGFGRHGIIRVPLPAMPASGRILVQVDYLQPVAPAPDGTTLFTYPVSVAPPPADRFSFGIQVTTAHGFRHFASPTHPMAVEWGTEQGPCPPRYRCGTMSIPSRRVRIARLESDAELARDIEVAFSPAAPGELPDPTP
jgi:hypothetical protein